MKISKKISSLVNIKMYREGKSAKANPAVQTRTVVCHPLF